MRKLSPLMIGFAAVVGLILVMAVIGISGFFKVETVNATVSDKDRVCTIRDGGGNECKYLVFTDNGTFQNTDNVLRGKVNSSDVQGSINVGDNCTFEVSGYRIPLFSTYQNILKADCQS